jgi:addiction module HigA family antidote
MTSLRPVHPGDVLRKDFLEPLGMTPYRLARELRVTPVRINDIVRRRRAVSADTALRLGAYFGTSPQFWLNLQVNHDLEVAARKSSRILSGIRSRGVSVTAGRSSQNSG